MRYLIVLLALMITAAVADTNLAGSYSGDWKSNGGGGNGSFKLSLESASNGAWKCDVTFTFGGADVKTSMCAAKVTQSKLEASYDFDLMGNTLRSKISGELKGTAIDGTYQTTSVDGGTPVDDGVWNATRSK